jgi:hypothetical protein
MRDQLEAELTCALAKALQRDAARVGIERLPIVRSRFG